MGIRGHDSSVRTLIYFTCCAPSRSLVGKRSISRRVFNSLWFSDLPGARAPLQHLCVTTDSTCFTRVNVRQQHISRLATLVKTFKCVNAIHAAKVNVYG